MSSSNHFRGNQPRKTREMLAALEQIEEESQQYKRESPLFKTDSFPYSPEAQKKQELRDAAWKIETERDYYKHELYDHLALEPYCQDVLAYEAKSQRLVNEIEQDLGNESLGNVTLFPESSFIETLVDNYLRLFSSSGED